MRGQFPLMLVVGVALGEAPAGRNFSTTHKSVKNASHVHISDPKGGCHIQDYYSGRAGRHHVFPSGRVGH